MKIEYIEFLIVCAILVLQVLVFVKTYRQIKIYETIIPDLEYLKIINLNIPVDDLKIFAPGYIIDNVSTYLVGRKIQDTVTEESDELSEANEVENEYVEVETTELNIISTTNDSEVNDNAASSKMFYSINNYLIRNRGASTDFNLIKDIVDRNSNTIEEDINLSVGVPLYLGLMGTMLGIVIGLFNMPDLSDVIDTKEKDLLLNNGITILINGVKIAMIASFTGLLLTVLNSGWFFKKSRNLLEHKKNDLYTYIQTELLPIVNQGLASTLDSLQRNLLRFNQEFTTNLKSLNNIFDSNRNAIREQKELLDALNKAKVSEMTKYNVAVLQQLDLSVTKFEKFNAYLTNVNQLADNSQLIVGKTNELLSRTDNFKSIADKLELKIEESQNLLEFLSAHFKKLDEHRMHTSNAVADVGFAIKGTFDELKNQIQTTVDSMKKFTVEELDILKTALSSSKTNLSNLEYLSTLKSDVSQFKSESNTQSLRLKNSLDQLNKNMEKSIELLGMIEQQSIKYKAKGVTNFFRNMFKSKS
jgi:hypothetical protein